MTYFYNACLSHEVPQIYNNSLSTSMGSGNAYKECDKDLRKRGRILSDYLEDLIRMETKDG